MKSENHKTTTVQHLGAKPTASQIANLALELSRKADGTIDMAQFQANLQIAYEAMQWIQQGIDALG